MRVKPTVEELRAHVIAIATEHGIRVEFDHSRGGRAWRRDRRIRTMPIKSPVTYILAMHELGHLLGRDQSHRRIVQEIAAWEWALEHSIAPRTKALKRKVSRCLSSYVRHYFWHRQAWLPRPGSSDPYERQVWARMERLLRLGHPDPKTIRRGVDRARAGV